MRQVGDIVGLENANRFLNFLAKEKIQGELREEDAGIYRVWVVNEDQLEQAEQWFREFLQTPNDPRFKTAIGSTPKAPPKATPRPLVAQERGFGTERATLVFVLISIALTFLRDVPGAEHLMNKLFFSQRFERGFSEILSGEIWRIITPIFIHRDWLHLIFNMLWLFQLGGAIERLEGTIYFSLNLLVAGILCNTAQYLVSGPAFMGMSGVVYELLGYIWMMSKYQPATRYELPQQTIGFMLIWLVICLIGLIPNVANTQHVLGLIIGVTWGFLRSGRPRELRRKSKFKRLQR